ncbi:MAG: flagellin lysine-N-methylase [Clostridia bacterium]|nr:flagellin lysine-N-methylase [Clostridia bacterium]
MKLVMPAYCTGFKCTANKCSDNCCIGWEIDIDGETADFYSRVKGDFGAKLKENIAHGECSSFILKGERCPFLNEKNLCDIIINLGEEHLCQICADHPRYYEWFGDIKEGGIGLCCEEAAKLILTAGNPVYFTETDIPEEVNGSFDKELFELLYKARDRIFFFLYDEFESIKTIVSRILFFAEKLQYNIDNYIDELPAENDAMEEKTGDMLSVLRSLSEMEPIDEKWTDYLADAVSTYKKTDINEDGLYLYQRNLLFYYIYRYFLKGVFDGEILSKVKFACVSTAVISYFAVKENADFQGIINICKLFSKQTEYSQENIDMLCEMFYEKEFFESGKIIGLF